MNLYWSSQRAIANSKVVKSSAIWLVLVPFAAKALAGIDEIITFNLFNSSIAVKTSLPFSWQLLFLAAVSFTLAGIIYSASCPELVKQYTSFTQFEGDGKSRMQIMHALKNITWNRKTGQPKEEYLPHLTTYFSTYSDNSRITAEEVRKTGRTLFNDITSNRGKNSNAFYFVHEISDKHSQPLIWASFMLYMLGFFAIGAIGIQNVIYVVGTFG